MARRMDPELLALRRIMRAIARNLPNVGQPGKTWLRERLTAVELRRV